MKKQTLNYFLPQGHLIRIVEHVLSSLAATPLFLSARTLPYKLMATFATMESAENAGNSFKKAELSIEKEKYTLLLVECSRKIAKYTSEKGRCSRRIGKYTSHYMECSRRKGKCSAKNGKSSRKKGKCSSFFGGEVLFNPILVFNSLYNSLKIKLLFTDSSPPYFRKPSGSRAIKIWPLGAYWWKGEV